MLRVIFEKGRAASEKIAGRLQGKHKVMRSFLSDLAHNGGAFVRGAGAVYLQNLGHDFLGLVHVVRRPDVENRLAEFRNPLVALF